MRDLRIARGCLPVDDIGDTFRIAQGWLPVDDNILHAIYCPLTTMGMRLESLGVALPVDDNRDAFRNARGWLPVHDESICMIMHDAIIFAIYMCMHVSHAKQRSACFMAHSCRCESVVMFVRACRRQVQSHAGIATTPGIVACRALSLASRSKRQRMRLSRAGANDSAVVFVPAAKDSAYIRLLNMRQRSIICSCSEQKTAL